MTETKDPLRLRKRWKKQWREIDEWARDERKFHLEDFLHSDYTSMEAWFERWPRPWPVALQREIVARLVDAHERWDRKLGKLFAGRKVPLYLGIWLFDDGLMESQLVAAIGERAQDYASRHSGGERVPPPSLYDTPSCPLGRFEWTRHLQLDRDPIGDQGPAWRWHLLRSARSLTEIDGQTHVVTGRRAWFGRLPAGAGRFDYAE